MTTVNEQTDPSLILSIVGCRGGVPADGWPSSCYVVDVAGERVMLDCGPGAATSLSRRVGVATLTAVFLSHRHLDHCFDLVVVGKQWLQAADRPAERLPLYVPSGVGDVLRRVNALLPIGHEPGHDVDRVFDTAFDVRELSPGGAPVTVGEVEVTPVPMRHRIASFGLRVETPAGVLAYSGDTGPTDAFVPLASGADLLLAEATLDHSDTTGHGHLAAAEAGAAATAASVGSLVLTHLVSSEPEWIAGQRQAAADRFAGPVFVATPGARFAVRPSAPVINLPESETP